MSKNKKRTNDNIAPYKDGRRWVSKRLETMPIIEDHNGKRMVAFNISDDEAFKGPISDVIDLLTKVRNHYETKGFRRITIDFNYHRDGFDLDVELEGYKIESKTIANERIALNKRKRSFKKQKELQEYKRLKKIYGTD